ncbi:MAG: hypothetical protein HY863_15765 [Chloroflexi bacterium]|nr:hypothetical protein [Chloroflexota bacterium]
MIETSIVTYLTTHAPLVAMQETRVWPDRLPQDPTVPATVFFSVSDPTDYSHSGPSAWKEQRFQFDCWANNPLEAIELKNRTRRAFSGYKGMMGTTEIYAAFVENARTMDDDETGLYRRVLEVLFQYKEA